VWRKLVGAAQRQEAPANGLGQVRLGALLFAQRCFKDVPQMKSMNTMIGGDRSADMSSTDGFAFAWAHPCRRGLSQVTRSPIHAVRTKRHSPDFQAVGYDFSVYWRAGAKASIATDPLVAKNGEQLCAG
jgi:hypothetical protein